MTFKVDPEYLAQKARSAGEEVAEEIASVHGSLWAARDNLTKLVLSLSAVILAGTISFSGTILEHSASVWAALFLVLSWLLFFAAICCGLASLWNANTLHSFRARFTNAEPDMKQDAESIKGNSENEIMDSVLTLMKQYSDRALNPLGSADTWANRLCASSLLCFGAALLSFIVAGCILVT